MKTKGIVFDIQRFSLHDGPGVRTLVFLKGCPLRCKWCHNPEGLLPTPQLMYKQKKCIGCGDCIKVCPTNAHFMENDFHGYNRELCINCGLCAEVCCSEALTMSGKEMTVDEVLNQVMRDSVYYKDQGGITLSGGEPMMQADFAYELLKEAKNRGLTTCIETCGYASAQAYNKIAEYTDLFLFDYKVTGEELHKEMTGVSLKVILDNLRMLDKKGCKIILRCPLIPQVNVNEKHIKGIAEVANSLKNIQQIHLEPYHDMGLTKADFAGVQMDFNPPLLAVNEEKEFKEKLLKMTNIPVIIM